MAVLLDIQLFGTFQVTAGGLPVNGFRSDKVRALLAYLAVEANRQHRRDALAGLLWPEMPEAKAHDNLRLALHRLRQALHVDGIATPEQFLDITPKAVQFKRSSDSEVDVAVFTGLLAECQAHRHSRPENCIACTRRRAQAVALYRGDLLQGFFVDCQPFDEWLTIQREALRFQVLETLNLLAAYYEGSGDYAQAQHYARRQLDLDAWCEEAHRQLMRSLALAGQRSAALAQYDICARLLQEELAVDPEDETRELYQRIRSGEKIISASPEPDAQHVAMSNRAAPPASLPISITPFAGRQAELSQIDVFMETPDARLLSLVGPGGVGKTRLAHQAAGEWRGSFPQGIYFIPLADVDTPDLLLPVIAECMGVASHANGDFKAVLMNYLCGREALLVLDNFEHLLAASGEVAEILSQAARVKILVTSLQRLGLEQEQVIELAGLDYPADGDSGEATAVESCSAVQLFVDSAARLGGCLVEGCLPAVVRICQLVDGLPLALELAAAWTRVLFPAEIAREIERDLGFLAASQPETPERQRSLRVVYAASWNLLSAEERRAWQSLSVFRGGFSLDAGLQVAGASPHLLAALIDKSLLHRGADGRFEVHELLRQFAAEKLGASPGEYRAIAARHAVFYLEFIHQRKAALEDAFRQGQRPAELLLEIDREIDNLRACTRSLFAPGRSDLPGEEATVWAYVDGLRLFYEFQGWPQEIKSLYELLLAWAENLPEHSTSPALRAGWRFYLGKACLGLGQIASSRAWLERASAEWDVHMPGPAAEIALASLGQIIYQASHRLVSWLAPAHRLRLPAEADLSLIRIFEQYAEIGYLTGERALSLYCVLKTLNLAERLDSSPELARSSANLCLGAGLVGLHSLANIYSHQARRALQSLQDTLTQAYVLQVTGIYDITRARWENAMQSLEQAAELYRNLGRQHQWGMCAMPRFVILHSQGKFTLAQDQLQSLADAAQSSGDLVLKTWHLLGQALLDLDVGKTGTAIACIEASLQIHRETAYPTMVMMAYAMLSEAYLRQGEPWRARQAADDAVSQITRSTHTVFTSSVGFSAAADTYLSLYERSDPGDVAERQYFLRQIRTLLKEMRLQTRSIPATQSYYWSRLGNYRWLGGAHCQAFAAWERALQAAGRFHLPLEQGRAHLEIGRHLKSGDPNRQAHLQQAGQLFDEMGAIFNLRQAQAEIDACVSCGLYT